MNFARMRQRVQVQSKTDSVGSDGQPSRSWSNSGSPVWCYAIPVAVGEFTNADQQAEGTTWLIEMRYRTGVSHTMRGVVSIHGTSHTIDFLSVKDVDNLGKALQIAGFERKA